MGEVVPVAEIRFQLAAARQAPVVENHRDVVVDARRVALLDDQGAVEPFRHLLPGTLVRVVPVGAGMGYVENVVERIARLDRRLGEARNAVHRVVDVDPVPVDGGGAVDPVFKSDGHPAALAGAYLGTGR